MLTQASAIQRRSNWISYMETLTGSFGENTEKLTARLRAEIDRGDISVLISHLRLCGAVPEKYGHDSTQEKLYFREPLNNSRSAGFSDRPGFHEVFGPPIWPLLGSFPSGSGPVFGSRLGLGPTDPWVNPSSSVGPSSGSTVPAAAPPVPCS